jgi:hypothetical protein
MGAHQNREEQQNPQSQSIPGPTNENPNEDVENGTQSQIQPGGQGDGNTSTGGVSVPSDGGNPAANQGGASGQAGGNAGASGQR